jgi:hypothetical protein
VCVLRSAVPYRGIIGKKIDSFRELLRQLVAVFRKDIEEKLEEFKERKGPREEEPEA